MKTKHTLFVLFVIALFLFSFAAIAQDNGDESDADFEDNDFTLDFAIEDCTFRDRGDNPYFPLKPGYQLVLEGQDAEGTERVEITVLSQKERIRLEGFGRPSIKTRVVEEREFKNDSLAEVSWNFFAICKETGDVFYFGEDVDIYQDGRIVSHDGAWRAGQDGALPGIIMPGRFLLGSKYFQEQALGVAMDRAEHKEMGLELKIEAGTLEDCVFIEETSPLDTGVSEKIYCPAIGLSQDGDAQLVEYGFLDD